jgi:hypothetical protein
MAKSALSRSEAFKAYVDMGEERSINGLFTQLKAKGVAIGRQTLINWHRDDEWDKRLPAELCKRDLLVNAVQTAIEARELAQAAESMPEPVRRSERGDDFVAAIAHQGEVQAPEPFDLHQQFEGMANALQGTAAALAVTATAHLQRLSNPNNFAIDLNDLLTVARAAAEVAKAAAEVQKVLNPVAPAPKGKAPPERDPQTGALIGEVMAPVQGFGDADKLLEALANPPRMAGKT